MRRRPSLHRKTLYAFTAALDGDLHGDVRRMIHDLLDAFWIHPAGTKQSPGGS